MSVRPRALAGSACALALALAGCGGGGAPARPAATPAGHDADAVGAPAASHARTLIRMTRVQGDDPMPYGVVLHADRIAAVSFGGGHGGSEEKVIRLSASQQRRVVRAIRAAPWRRVDGHTVVPGGFAASDNGNRYSVYHGRWSTVLAAGHMPARMARLLRLLDAIIDGDLGRQLYARRHSPIPVTPAPPGSG